MTEATASMTVAIESLNALELPFAMTRMDPRLQRASALFASGRRRLASASTGDDEIAVIAKVRDLRAWTELSEVRPGVTMGEPDADGVVIATARIPIRRIESVRSQPFVVSLKAAQRVTHTLAATLSETQSRPVDLPKKSGVDGGKGVVLGVVDFGADFVHRNLRTTAGKTRFEAIWDQTQPGGGGPGAPPYGLLHRRAAIDLALRQPNPYATLNYAVGDREHGTHVLDIAGGNGRGTGQPGMAPRAELIFVQLAASDIPWGGPGVVGANFGDSVQMLEALEFIFAQAGSRPCVINLSLGTNGGPHDGTTLVEQGIDRLVRAAPNRAVIIAASNSQGDGIHAMGTVPAGGTLDLVVTTVASAQGPTEDECEVWYAGARRLNVQLLAPNGAAVAQVGPGSTVQILNGSGQVVGVVANRLADPNNGDNLIDVWWSAAMPKGNWTLRLAGAEPTPFHAWIERNDAAQASFASQRVDSHTLGSISCGHESIVVASYDAHKATTPISWFSSSGPTRDGRSKPEVSAPGHAVVAARSTTVTGTTAMSGTSMAAPAATGLVALVLARANARKLKLASAQIRAIVTACARLNPPPSAWDPRYGHGRISGRAAVAQLMGNPPPGSAPAAAGKAVGKRAPAKSAPPRKAAAKKAGRR